MYAKLRSFLLGGLTLLTAAALHAATLNVGSGQPYATIQSAIDAAAPGDTVLVAPGTYYENIDFKGKAITVTSSAGPATTIIDGGSVDAAVTFKSSEPRTAILSNLTIQNGGGSGNTYTGLGNGGIFINNSAPSILNNVITHNNCWGIDTGQTAALIQDNEISATQSPDYGCGFGSGAAIYIGGNLLGGSPAASDGTPPVINGNTLENNLLSGLSDAGGNGGAGIAVWGGSPIIENNIIRNNASPGGTGGAINIVYGSGAVIVQNLIYGNSAGCGAGALAFDGGSVSPGFYMLVANNIMVNNTSQSNAGYSNCIDISQIYPYPDTYGSSGPSAVFVNNIISGSTTEPALNCDQFGPATEATQPIFDHNLLYNAGGVFFGSFCVDVSAKYGNISADPQFVDPANGNFNLRPGSPAIDIGNNSVLQSIAQLAGRQLTKDFAGSARLQDATGKGYPIIDMGAYEFRGTVNATPTTIVLSSSAYTGDAGAGYTLTATLASALGIPTGDASFFLDGKAIGSSPIDSTGVATLPNALIQPGVHSLYATYAGEGSFTPATSVILIVQINPYDTQLSIASSTNPSLVGQSVTFMINATSADSTYIPTPILLKNEDTGAQLASLIPDSAGVATFTTSFATAGYYNIEASYTGDSIHASANTSLSQQVVTGYTTATTLTCTPNQINLLATALLSANLTSTNGTPTGAITFADNGATLSQVTLANGAASTTYTGRSAGTHTLTATFVPTGAFATSSATCAETVNGLPSTATLSVNPKTGSAGSPITLTAAIAPATPPGPSTPTGTVTFLSSGIQVGSADLTHGVAALTLTNLPAGTHALSCTYSGDTSYAPSTCNNIPITLTAAPTTTTLTSSANPSPAFTATIFTVNLSSNSEPVSGRSVTLSGLTPSPVTLTTDSNGDARYTTGTLTPGTYLVTATFPATSSYLGSTASIVEQVTFASTFLSLSASPNPATPGQLVTCIATLNSSSGAPISGSVLFYDGAAPLATVALVSGRATFTTSQLAVGTHPLSVAYPGDANTMSSVSPTVKEVILNSDFTLASDPTTLTLRTGHHTTFTLTATSVGLFTGNLELSNGILPLHTTVRFSSRIMTLAQGSQSTTSIYLDTDDVIGFLGSNRPPSIRPRTSTLLAAAFLPCLLLLFSRRRRPALPMLLTLMLTALILVSASGCSGKYPASAAPGIYSIQITATAPGQQTSHTLAIPLTVTE